MKAIKQYFTDTDLRVNGVRMGKADQMAARIMMEMAAFREYHTREALKQWVSELEPSICYRQTDFMLGVEIIGVTAEGHSDVYVPYHAKRIWHLVSRVNTGALCSG